MKCRRKGEEKYSEGLCMTCWSVNAGSVIQKTNHNLKKLAPNVVIQTLGFVYRGFLGLNLGLEVECAERSIVFPSVPLDKFYDSNLNKYHESFCFYVLHTS